MTQIEMINKDNGVELSGASEASGGSCSEMLTRQASEMLTRQAQTCTLGKLQKRSLGKQQTFFLFQNSDFLQPLRLNNCVFCVIFQN